MSRKKLLLSNLLVNTENYRFENVSDVRAALDVMIEDQKDYLYNLADSIVQKGLNPTDPIQVYPSSTDKNKYIVLEGNRRIVSLKLLNNPDLLDGHTELRKKFKKLKEKNTISHLNQIECLVFDNPEDAQDWIAMKHGYTTKPGVSTEKWTPLQKERYEERTSGKSSILLQVMNLLNKSPHVPITLKNTVKKIKTTNLGRLMEDPDVRKSLGIELKGGVLQSSVEEEQVVKAIVHIANDVLNPKFKVKEIYDKKARLEYVDKIPKSVKPDLKKVATKPWQFNTVKSSGAASPSAKPPKTLPKDRDKLIPKSCDLEITVQKINNIFHELKTLNVHTYENATAVLLRVFIELSVDAYLDKHRLATTISASTMTGLAPKINLVANHLENKKLADKGICTGIKNAIKDKNDILNVDTWHAYVHNTSYRQKPENLIRTWDSVQPFITILWENIK